MKKKFIKTFLMCLMFLSILNAQTGVIGTNFSCVKISDNYYQFIFNTGFSIGYGPTCPPFVNYTITTINDTLFVRAFYNTTGVWPAAGCNRTDTVNYNNEIPQNINYITMSTNVTTYNNNPPYEPPIVTLFDVYSQTFSVASLSNNNFNDNNENLIVFPNPTNGSITILGDANYNKFIIYNNLGQIINTTNRNEIGIYNLINLPAGLFTIIYYDINNIKIGESRLLKN